MAGDASQSDFWDVLDEAEMTVERWPPWQRDYDPDIFYDEDAPARNAELQPRQQDALKFAACYIRRPFP